MTKSARQASGWTRACAVLVSFSILTAEFAVAQGFPGQSAGGQGQQGMSPVGPGQQFGFPGGPGQQFGFPVAPDQTIVTNPTALLPLSPTQVPCPPPPVKQQVAPQQVVQPFGLQVGPGQQGVPQAGSGQLSTPQAGLGQQGIPPGGPGQQFGLQGGLGQQGIPPGGPGGQQFGLQGGLGQQGIPPGGLSQQFGLQGVPGQQQVISQGEDLSIEEGFSRFFVLQGITSQLRQFGYNFFDFPVSTFAPVMDVPVGLDYVLGPDDTLSVHLWNVPDASFNRSFIVPVERDGTIFLPQVGPIPVAGQTFSEASRLIKARVGRLLKRFEIHIATARLRTIKVYVVGEVVRPGAYEVSSLAAASNAIYAACGPAKSGSLRRVQVVREGKVIAELDFYRFLLKGDRSQDVRLQSGDTILIPPIGPVVAIGGPVRRQAIYELTKATTLTDLIVLAGGLAPSADRKRCQIFRIEEGKNRVILDIDFDKALATQDKKANGGAGNDPLIHDGDFVKIASVTTEIENSVSLAGAVRNPGSRELKPGMRVRDLLGPDQLLVDAYLDLAELIRTDPVTYATSVLSFSPKRLFAGNPEDNYELRRSDKVMISTQFRPAGAVTVMGEVRRAGVYNIEIGERLSSVLKRVGGLTERAFPQGLVLIRESVKTAQQVELQRFVAVQKQQLLSQAAAYTSGGEAASEAALKLQLQQLDTLAALTPPGRVVIKMESLEKFEGTVDDVMLEHGDQITIPQPPQTVAIMGAVRTPSTVVYRGEWRLEDYLKQAGLPTEEANQKQIYVVHANGATDAAFLKVKPLAPGDTIVVPPKVEPKYRALTLWQTVASAISSVALTAASLAVIGR